MIAPALQSLAVDIDDIVLDPKNARSHDERNLAAIRASFERFGQRQPIVVQREGLIVRVGNARVRAARQLGWPKIAAVIVDEDDVEATAYAIADNKTGDLAEWDFEVLSGLFSELVAVDFDLDATGFADFEIDPLLAADWSPEAVKKDALDVGGKGDEPGEYSLKFTDQQKQLISAALKKWRAANDGEAVGDAQAVSVICQAYLA